MAYTSSRLLVVAAVCALAATCCYASAAPTHTLSAARAQRRVLSAPPSEFCNGGNRTDCGYVGINQQICQSRGCCWSPVNEIVTHDGTQVSSQPRYGGIPWCFFKSPPSPSCSTSPQCSGHGACAAGNGTCTCSSGYTTCAAAPTAEECAVDTQTDPADCGACGQSCPTGTGVASSTCSLGKCVTQCSTGYKLCFGECIQGTTCAGHAPFSPSDVQTMTGFFEANLNVNGGGGVAASPSKQNPNYFFHWQRDGAISMRAYMNTTTLAGYTPKMESYVNWVHKAQFASDPNNIDVRGEPKFFLGNGGAYGNVYNQGWLRPQNDGCALRTIAQLLFGFDLLKAGQRDYVAANIWTGSADKPGVQRDLEYTLAVWPQNSGDPWEEVTGQIFFDKFAHRHALILGARMANEFGNTTAASVYTKAAAEIESNIISVHWNPSKGIIMEVPNTRELDSATHLGVINGHMADGFLDPASEKVQSSVAVLVSSFQNYGDFTINAKDSAAGIPGLMVGRYLYDHYNGGNPSQPGGGNPWILCTAALANIYYQSASLHAQRGVIEITDVNAAFFEQALGFAAPVLAAQSDADAQDGFALAEMELQLAELRGLVAQRATLQLGTSTGAALARMTKMLTLSGDAILLRLRHHVQPLGFHLPEELNKDSGASQGAHDLTWSYGTMLDALHSRSVAGAAVDAVAARV